MNELEVMGMRQDAEQEEVLGREVTTIELEAEMMKIQSDADFEEAAEVVKRVKAAQKKVEAYWEPMRKTTYDAYKAVTDHKKEMIDPLKRAEQVLKKKMGGYQAELARKKREEEERIRRIAMEEMERKLAEAEKAESAGDASGAEFAMAEAEVLDNMAGTISLAKPEKKVKGISQSKAWEIERIDLSKLPDEFAGVLIRPADEKAIMNLIKATKGTIKIPGVEYRETVNISVRVS